MNNIRDLWLDLIGKPDKYEFDHTLKLVKIYHYPTYDVESYIQANGPSTTQRLMIAVPKNLKYPLPCVAVPFYYPEAMLGFDPETEKELDAYGNVAMMKHLLERGYIVASADSYHLTYIDSEKTISDFSRWRDAGTALKIKQPKWTGIGKLVFDTQLMLDVLSADTRVDSSRIGIIGHSLGGKMAFYTGCLDDRVKVIVASDFGIGWDQTNWDAIWYWGDKVKDFKAAGIDHSSLLSSAAPKPMLLIAGEYDNDESFEMMKRALGYDGAEDNLKIVNHATGHRPPREALQAGYDFLEMFLK